MINMALRNECMTPMTIFKYWNFNAMGCFFCQLVTFNGTQYVIRAHRRGGKMEASTPPAFLLGGREQKCLFWNVRACFSSVNMIQQKSNKLMKWAVLIWKEKYYCSTKKRQLFLIYWKLPSSDTQKNVAAFSCISKVL